MIGTTISHYKILEKLGEGGMGVVYKAQDTKLDRFVAIKFLPSHLSSSEENKERFMQEARATAALSHPNILNVFEIDEYEGGLFFVMEFLEGRTLRSHISTLKSSTGIPYAQVIEWTIQIANGLQAAHQKNIVHRDIKPENIMVTGNGQLKIMDFGIAKLKSGSGLTKTGTSLGTLSYMSPEQAQGLPADNRSDIWALGVVVYEMLTADLPFKAEHEAALLYLIVNDDPPLTSSMDKKIPRQFDSLVMKMLAKDPAHRFANAGAVLLALSTLKSEIETTGGATKAKGITVLPFGNMSPDKDSDYFCDGLTEELIVNLSKLKDIRVVPRSKAMQYKGTNKEVKVIGRELGTRYVLSGNVRKFQDNLRISVELIDIEIDEQLWAETYKGKLADVFDIQEQVSKQIVDTMLVKISPTEKVVLTKRPTLNTEAFDCYLRARNFLYQLTKNSVQFAIQVFQKAIELDARYADAYAGLGEAYAFFYQIFDRREEWLDKAIEASLKALMYDPTLSEAYSALSLSHFHKNSLDEASAAGRKAIELDPNNYLACWILGRIYHTADRDREALELFNKVMAINPDFYSVYSDLQIVYGRLGLTAKCQEMLHTALAVYPRYLSQHPDDARCHMFYAVDLAQSGRKEEAKSEAKRALELNPNDPLMLYNAACFYAQMGEASRAVEMLRNAIAAGYPDYEWFKRDPDLDSIRNDPGYVALMKGK
ncbi:MAG TPA: protein kinase [Bacteroidota bacterium]|jgi:serine/threonine protein kinase/Flp pilus assembly protein TadD|nr:protein kinase [Bacteroidota bacterium]